MCVCVQKGQSEGCQVLVLGLDGAGKSSLLQCFVTGSTEQEVSPTQGFHAVSINREGLHIEFLESMYLTVLYVHAVRLSIASINKYLSNYKTGHLLHLYVI